ncbi:hypothetical protein BDQ17DRAFT_1425241 [Cyathus striatus]|nr:hypothetical protein BDQ17DRAFT_1425241 [Cyathus striatus]
MGVTIFPSPLATMLVFIAKLLYRRFTEALGIISNTNGIDGQPPQEVTHLALEEKERHVLVTDVKVLLSGGTPRLSEHSNRVLEDVKKPKGNALDASVGASSQTKFNLTLRMAELIHALHSFGIIHGNIFPVCILGYLTLFDAKLYAAAQEGLEYIRIGLSHGYKARAELARDEFIPAEAMDVFGWAKSVIAIYVGAQPTSKFWKPIPLPTQPMDMPDALWGILQGCLREDLANLPSMDDIITNLKMIKESVL